MLDDANCLLKKVIPENKLLFILIPVQPINMLLEFIDAWPDVSLVPVVLGRTLRESS